MSDQVPDRVLRQVGIAAAVMAAQREILQNALKQANLAGHSLRQLSAVSGISHEAVRRMINDENAKTRKAISESLANTVQQSGITRVGFDRQMRAMLSEASRQSRQINAQMAKQVREALNAAMRTPRPPQNES